MDQKYGSKGSRADSTTHKFTDIFYHLWDQSSPKFVEMERKVQRKKPKDVTSTEIEMLVESLFLYYSNKCEILEIIISSLVLFMSSTRSSRIHSVQ